MATTPQPQPPQRISLDKADIVRWRLDANGFVVKDWTGLDQGAEPMIAVLKSSEVFEFIAEAAQRKAKVAVYAIGPCVIDWT